MVAFSYRGSEPAEQHKALLEAALRRDADSAIGTLQVHVHNCVEHALAKGLSD
jgi:DNA-binding GntR family transcriptional regulator